MKTATIKDLLKKDILIVELPDGVKSWEFLDGKFWVDGKQIFIKGFTPFHTLLGKPDEIKEDDARELVFEDDGEFADYKHDANWFPTATKSLLSAIETVIFWDVNPLDEPSDEIGCECEECQEGFEIKYNDFMIAQEKTFDKSRTLIFVKN